MEHTQRSFDPTDGEVGYIDPLDEV